jgi:hypothetical protein
MGNLILDIVQNYFIVGISIALITDLIIRLTNISEAFSLKQAIGFAIVWPFVVGTLIIECINGDF